MSQVVLVHLLQTFKVQARLIIFKCDLFGDNPGLAASPYTVQSQVSLTDFGEFVSALAGNAVQITKDNFKGLSALCGEFRFGDLDAALSQFRDSDNFKGADTIKDSEARRRFSALEERIHQRDHVIASLQSELLRRSQAQESAMEAVLERLSQLEADRAFVGSLSTEVARLRELQSMFSNEVGKVREHLREAKESADDAKDIGLASRAVAEEAEKKAEAYLGRVGQLEAELLALRSAPVPAETKPAATAPTFPPSIVPPASVAPAAPTSPLATSPPGSVPQAVVSIASAPAPTSPPSAVAPPPSGWNSELVGESRSAIDNLRRALKEVRELAEPSGWNSAIVPDFPKLFADFKTKQFTLLWRGSRDGFGSKAFHSRCDGHPNTLTVISDTNGNI
jgi:flagellar biosynthesis chaperone FliJ